MLADITNEEQHKFIAKYFPEIYKEKPEEGWTGQQLFTSLPETIIDGEYKKALDYIDKSYIIKYVDKENHIYIVGGIGAISVGENLIECCIDILKTLLELEKN